MSALPPPQKPTPRERRRLLGLFAVSIGVAAATLLAMLALPHDRYIRWQSLKTEAYARLGWVYERIHFDPTPIDIAFIGTSHTMNGVDAGLVERELAAMGVRTPEGRCYTATNLAIPSYGRNLHAVIARELFRSRPVKRLVLEVFENETRKAHPAFVHVADLRDVTGAPWLININLLPDLVRLPFRQVSLWAQTQMPREFGVTRTFRPDAYDGSTVDNTRVVNAGGVALTAPRTTVAPRAELEAQAHATARAKNLHMLGGRLAALEYRYPLHYLNAVLDAAKADGAAVSFLYLPAYAQPPQPYDAAPYAGRGDWIFANDILRQPDLWHDAAHLNAQGAHLLSLRVAQALATRLPRGPLAGVPCDFGRPERAVLTPFHTPA